MLKIVKVFITLAAISMFFGSCKKESTSTKAEEIQENPKTSESLELKVPTRFIKECLIIKSGRILYEKNSDGDMVAVKEANMGEKAYVTYFDNDRLESTNNLRLSDKESIKNVKFIKVLYDEDKNEYWTRDIYITNENGEAAVPAVLVENTSVYADDSYDSLTDDVLEAGTCFAFYEDADTLLNKICLFDGSPYGKIIYVKDSISTSKNKMEYLALLKRKNEAQESVVKTEVQELLDELKAAAKEEQENYERMRSGK